MLNSEQALLTSKSVSTITGKDTSSPKLGTNEKNLSLNARCYFRGT